MTWRELPRNPTARVLRQFAAGWLVVFVALGALQAFGRARPLWGLGLALLGMGVGGIGWQRPRAIRWLFLGCLMAAFPLGWVVSQLILLLLFYGLFTPVALCFRCIGRDALARRLRPGAESYWTEKVPPANLRRYFRPY